MFLKSNHVEDSENVAILYEAYFLFAYIPLDNSLC